MPSGKDTAIREGDDTSVRPDRMKYLPYLAGIIVSSILYMFGTFKYGIGLSTDSVKYFSAADSIAGGNGFEIYSGELYYQYSPLTPMMLSIFPLLGIDTLAGAEIFFLLVYVLNVTLGLYILNMVIRSNKVKIIGMIMIMFSLSLYRVSTMLYSEPLFILLTQASLIFLYKYIRDRRNYQFVILIGFSALACLCRYVGIILLITSAVIIVLTLKGPLVRRIGLAAVYGFSSGIPTLVFVARNYHLTDTLLGERYGSNYGILDNLIFVSRTITGWFVPDFLIMDLFVLAYGLLAAAAVVLIVINISGMKKLMTNNKMLMIMLCFSIIYIVYLVVSASRIGFDTLNNRFLSPVNLPVFICILIGVDIYHRRMEKVPSPRSSKTGSRKYIGYFLIVALIVMSLSQIGLTGMRVYRNYSVGSGGYNVDEFHDSDIIGYLKENDLDGYIYTNCPEALFLFLDINDARLSPRETYQASYERANELPGFNESISSVRDTYIVWFDTVSRSYLYDITELGKLYNLTLILDFSDGSIYRLE
ncbi:MAG: ArnT family glycosyltransferase [Thermoplasmatota archaeon]